MELKKFTIALLIIVIVGVAAIIQILRPLRTPKTSLAINTNPEIAGGLNISWPANAQGAICVANEGLIEKTPEQSPKPTASVAKIMTAYIILKDHPLAEFEEGPTLVLTSEDAHTYALDKKDNQSVVKVVAGEKLTERQMLEALLLPSANNIATALAKWDAGSVAAFVGKMNKMAQQLGMKDTHYVDPAGINLSTQSSAYDQLLLAQKAMEIKTFKKIVAMPQADLPVVGRVYNVNYMLGKGGIVGIKTGSMPEVGGNYVFASHGVVGSRKVLIIGALFGVDGKRPIMDALHASLGILKKTKNLLQPMTVVKKDQAVAMVSFRPNCVLTIKSSQAIDAVVWPQKKLHIKVQLKKMTLPIRKGDIVGTLTMEGGKAQTTTIYAAESITRPSLVERLTRLY